MTKEENAALEEKAQDAAIARREERALSPFEQFGLFDNLFSGYRQHGMLRKLEREMQRTFGDFGMPRLYFRGVSSEEIKETDLCYHVSVDLPGLSKGDIRVSLEDNVLSIQAQHTFEEKDKKEADGTVYHTIKRGASAYNRSIRFPKIVGDASPTFENGVLEVALPKIEIEQTKARYFEVK